MPKIPIFTSIPPTFIRVDGAGKDIGAQYLSLCISSWRDSGFEPMSINSDIERQSEPNENHLTRRIDLTSNAQNYCGKPMVYLSDFIKAACNITGGPVIIVNSDIVLKLKKETLENIINIKPGQCLISRRIDIKTLNCRSGREYANGYDFFAYHSKDLRMLIDSPFIFGLPWWDHFLPIYMFLNGVKQIRAERNFSYHLMHTTRWDWNLWIDLGNKYINLMRSEMKTGNNMYFDRLQHATCRHNEVNPSNVASKLKKLTNFGYKDDESYILRRTARMNEKFISSMAYGWRANFRYF